MFDPVADQEIAPIGGNGKKENVAKIPGRLKGA